MFTPAEPDGHVSDLVPAPVSATAPAAAPAFSFDRFFPDPATVGSTGTASASTEGALSGASVIGSDAGSESPASQPSSAGADLAQFAHWLKGLSNS